MFRFAKRIFLFLAVNVLVVVTISVVMSLLGVSHYVTARGIDFQALIIFCLVWGFAGALISLSISRIMAKWMMGVKLLSSNETNPELRRLVELVHQYARRAGIETMPEVGIYESPEPNAFATGPTKNRALVAVSSGLLQQLNKNEVDAVIGHEVAHIANGDMVTLTLIQGVINAFVMFLARVIAFGISQQVKEESRPMVNFVVTILLEIALSLLAIMVVAYFSRLREFRADQGGAKFSSRENMIGALEALGRARLPQVVRQEPESLAAFKISSRKTSGFRMLFSTHPPLEERIEALRRLSL